MLRTKSRVPTLPKSKMIYLFLLGIVALTLKKKEALITYKPVLFAEHIRALVFYMIETSVMKELITSLKHSSLKVAVNREASLMEWYLGGHLKTHCNAFTFNDFFTMLSLGI